jgi:hypothetical protein
VQQQYQYGGFYQPVTFNTTDVNACYTSCVQSEGYGGGYCTYTDPYGNQQVIMSPTPVDIQPIGASAGDKYAQMANALTALQTALQALIVQLGQQH